MYPKTLFLVDRDATVGGVASELADLDPPVSLIRVSRTCSEAISAYVSAAGRLISRHRNVSALMLTAESCLAASSRLGAA